MLKGVGKEAELGDEPKCEEQSTSSRTLSAAALLYNQLAGCEKRVVESSPFFRKRNKIIRGKRDSLDIPALNYSLNF